MTARLTSCALFVLLTVSSTHAQQLATWTISPTPVELGADDDDLFESVRYGRLLPGGHAVIADARGLFVRVYGPNGRRTAAFGRKGGGPGEFTSISGLWLTPQGRIGVWDGRSRRFTIFDRAGSMLATHSVRPQPSMPGGLEIFLGTHRNGDLLLGSLYLARRPEGTEVLAERWYLGRFSSTGEFRAAVGELRGMYRAHRTPLPFTPVPRVALRGDSVWFADGYDAELKLWSSNGQVVRTIQLPWRNRASNELWSQLEARLRARTDNMKNFRLELFAEVPRPEEIPSVGAILVDDRGNFWIKEYDPLLDSLWLKGGNAIEVGSGGRWRILSPAGTWIATLRMPDNLIPLDIAGNRLLAMARDELDVEHIVMHTIVR